MAAQLRGYPYSLDLTSYLTIYYFIVRRA